MGKWWGDTLSCHWTKKHFWALASASSFYRKLSPNFKCLCGIFEYGQEGKAVSFKKHLSCLWLIFKNMRFGPDILDRGNFIPLCLSDHSSFVQSKYRYDRRWLPIVIFIYWAGAVGWELLHKGGANQFPQFSSCYTRLKEGHFTSKLVSCNIATLWTKDIALTQTWGKIIRLMTKWSHFWSIQVLKMYMNMYKNVHV